MLDKGDFNITAIGLGPIETCLEALSGFSVKTVNEIWHKTVSFNVLSDFWLEVYSAI